MSRRQTNQRPRKTNTAVAAAVVGVVLILCFLMAFGAILAGSARGVRASRLHLRRRRNLATQG